MSSSDLAALWSAVAAVFAAGTSFLAYLVQRRDHVEAARPELVIDGWSRGPLQSHFAEDCVRFKTVRNVGNGPAFHVYIGIAHDVSVGGRKYPTAVGNSVRIPILPAGEKFETDSWIALYWKPGGQALEFNFFDVQIYYWDYRGRRHITTYTVLAARETGGGMMMNEVAPQLSVSSRYTVSQPIWRLKVQKKAMHFVDRLRSCQPNFARVPQPIRERLAKLADRFNDFR